MYVDTSCIIVIPNVSCRTFLLMKLITKIEGVKSDLMIELI